MCGIGIRTELVCGRETVIAVGCDADGEPDYGTLLSLPCGEEGRKREGEDGSRVFEGAGVAEVERVPHLLVQPRGRRGRGGSLHTQPH